MDSNNQQAEILAESPKPSTVSRIFRVFYEPSSAFKGFTGKLEWIVPLLIIAIVGGILGYYVRPIYTEGMYQSVVEKYGDNPQVLEYIDKQFEEARENPFHWYYPPLWLGMSFVIMAIIAGVGMITGNFIFGGKANFWIILNVVAFAAFVGFLGDVIRIAIMLSKDSMFVYTGLGLLKPANDGSFLYYLFRQVDIFSIWRIIVTSIGLGVVYNMKPNRFAYVLFGVWVIFIILVAVGNLFTGGTIVY